MDLNDEGEDIEALTELERAEEGNTDNDAVEEEDEVSDFFGLYKQVYSPVYN